MMTCYLEKCAALHYFGAIFLAIFRWGLWRYLCVLYIMSKKLALKTYTKPTWENWRGTDDDKNTFNAQLESDRISSLDVSLKWIEMFSTLLTNSDIQEWPTLHRIRLFQEVTLAPDEARLRRRHPPCKERIGCIQKWKRNLRSDEDGAIERWYWHGTGWFAAWSWLMPAWELISSDSAFRA